MRRVVVALIAGGLTLSVFGSSAQTPGPIAVPTTEVPQSVAPIVHDAAPLAHDVAPMAHDVAPIAHDVAPFDPMPSSSGKAKPVVNTIAEVDLPTFHAATEGETIELPTTSACIVALVASTATRVTVLVSCRLAGKRVVARATNPKGKLARSVNMEAKGPSTLVVVEVGAPATFVVTSAQKRIRIDLRPK